MKRHLLRALLVALVVTTAFVDFRDPTPAPVAAQADAFQLLVSSSSSRSNPVPLDGQTVSGNIYVFTSPDVAAIDHVVFFLNGSQVRVENNAPYDFAGGTVAKADPFKTTSLQDGSHSITAILHMTDGTTRTAEAQFWVANSSPSLSFNPGALQLTVAQGATGSATVNLTASGAAVAYAVEEDVPWLTVTPATGTTPQTLSLTVDATGLAPGAYSATARATAPGHPTATLTLTVHVSTSLGAPDQIHIAWVEDPATTLTFVWRTQSSTVPSVVEYRKVGEQAWQSATGSLRPSGADGTLHQVTIRSLQPSTAYEYRVMGDGFLWSDVFTTRTAPPPGPADFDAVYVADTGLIGRTDGLATGTEQVINEIAALDPLLVLLGGDYAYYNTDKRYGSLDDTIDAWFNQMQPIATQSVMMPTYGNHEVLLGEGYNPWAARFPTPDGFNNRRYYSFDVGDVHFISIFAVENSIGLPSDALAWIEQDILAAKNAGQRWIIPFFHVSPFADGSNHPSNLALRAQLGPLFESLGVKLAISSHDQAYERTYPLTDVPATNTPTSTSKTCYTMEDGVTWVKVSPGGKLSNINGSFSSFRTDPAPHWTAYRNNTMHNFGRLIVSSEGTLRFEAYGVTGDGSPPVIIDSFEYRDGNCPPALSFSTEQLTLLASQGDTATESVALAASDHATVSFTVEENVSWLTVNPTTGTAPAALQLIADANGLAPGTYTAVVTATAPGYLADTLLVTLHVTSNTFQIVTSASSNRANPVPLDGRTVSGNVFIFTTPDIQGIDRVVFALDGSPVRTESNPPYDFAGGTVGTAQPFNTNSIADGVHTITATFHMTDGTTQLAVATFRVSNHEPALAFSQQSLTFTLAPDGNGAASVTLTSSDGAAVAYVLEENAPWLVVSPAAGSTPADLQIAVDATGLQPGTYTATVTASASGHSAATLVVTLHVTTGSFELLMSKSSNRSNPVPLDGQVVSGNIYVFTSPDTEAIAQVVFSLDGNQVRTENNAPYDFAGGSVTKADPFNTNALPDGPHTITATLHMHDGSSHVVQATFIVDN